MCLDTALAPLSLAIPGSQGHGGGADSRCLPSFFSACGSWALATGQWRGEGGVVGRGRGRTRLDLCHQSRLSALRVSGADPSPASLDIPLRMGTREPMSQGLTVAKQGC